MPANNLRLFPGFAGVYRFCTLKNQNGCLMASTGKNNIGKWILGGIIAYGVWQYFKFANEQRMRLIDIGFNGSYIDATFEVNNPTDLSGSIDNLSGNLLYRNQPIGTVSTNFQPIPVPAGLPFPAKIRLQPAYGNILSNVVPAITNFNKNDFRFVGQMIFSGLTIPVNTTLA